MPGVPLHRLGRRRRIRRIRHRACGFRATHCPAGYADVELAPLLCAGIIGYRSLMRAELPPAGRLRDLRLRRQRAHHRPGRAGPWRRGARDDPRSAARELALALGAASAQGAAEPPPVQLDAAICSLRWAIWCCPRWRRWTAAARWRSQAFISATSRRSTISAICSRSVRSGRSRSNTRADAREFLDFAGSHRIAVTTPRYPLSRADHALKDLAAGRISGAAVLTVD